MKDYTVVLLRPPHLCEDLEYGQAVYVASRVKAKDVVTAVQAAQKEAFDADEEDDSHAEAEQGGYMCGPAKPEHYKLCVMFEGHHDPVLFGWQPH